MTCSVANSNREVFQKWWEAWILQCAGKQSKVAQSEKQNEDMVGFENGPDYLAAKSSSAIDK